MAHGELQIEVPVAQLLTTLKANRKKHLAEYEKAKTGWKKLLRKELEQKIAAIEKPNPKVHLGSIKNQKPQTYVDFYDQAIEMLEYASNDMIELDTQQFQEFVKDEWNWKAAFTTSNVGYAAAARRR